MTEYRFDEYDSITEIIELGRVLSEFDFKVHGKTLFERVKRIKNCGQHKL